MPVTPPALPCHQNLKILKLRGSRTRRGKRNKVGDLSKLFTDKQLRRSVISPVLSLDFSPNEEVS